MLSLFIESFLFTLLLIVISLGLTFAAIFVVSLVALIIEVIYNTVKRGGKNVK